MPCTCTGLPHCGRAVRHGSGRSRIRITYQQQQERWAAAGIIALTRRYLQHACTRLPTSVGAEEAGNDSSNGGDSTRLIGAARALQPALHAVAEQPPYGTTRVHEAGKGAPSPGGRDVHGNAQPVSVDVTDTIARVGQICVPG